MSAPYWRVTVEQRWQRVARGAEQWCRPRRDPASIRPDPWPGVRRIGGRLTSVEEDTRLTAVTPTEMRRWARPWQLWARRRMGMPAWRIARRARVDTRWVHALDQEMNRRWRLVLDRMREAAKGPWINGKPGPWAASMLDGCASAITGPKHDPVTMHIRDDMAYRWWCPCGAYDWRTTKLKKALLPAPKRRALRA